jgi:hypothetical protein
MFTAGVAQASSSIDNDAEYDFSAWDATILWNEEAEDYLQQVLKHASEAKFHHSTCQRQPPCSCNTIPPLQASSSITAVEATVASASSSKDTPCRRGYCLIYVGDAKKFQAWKALSNLNAPLYRLKLTDYHIQAGVREMQKGVACKNVESLYNDSPKLVELRQVTDRTLEDLSLELNVASTDLGFVLAGSTMLYHIMMVREDRHTNFEFTQEEADMRRNWALQTIEASKKDYISGVRCHNSQGQATSADRGDIGESELEEALLRAGVPKSAFLTQRDIVEREFAGQKSGSRATPDIIFNKPIQIEGRQVGWIDAKNKLLLPDVSSPKELERFEKQVGRYVERYGPGAILWTKAGFSSSIVKLHPSVAHFTLNKCQKKTEKKHEEKPYIPPHLRNKGSGKGKEGDANGNGGAKGKGDAKGKGSDYVKGKGQRPGRRSRFPPGSRFENLD